ncbi:MAG: PAS domain-containing protein [Fimbriimonadaceae bacterium]|nr:PAS domain-containing protein [Fimbriimonadaceae bacterium]
MEKRWLTDVSEGAPQAQSAILEAADARLLRALPTPTLITDRHGALMQWNGAIEQLFIDETMPGLDSSQSMAGLILLAAEVTDRAAGGATHSSIEILTVQGPRVVRAFAAPLGPNADRPHGWIIQLQDISEERRLEEALRTTTELLAQEMQLPPQLAEAVEQPLFVVDERGAVTLCNRAFAAGVLGVEPFELIGRRFDELPGSIPLAAAAICQGEVDDLLTVEISGLGRRICWELCRFPVFGANELVAATLVVLRPSDEVGQMAARLA